MVNMGINLFPFLKLEQVNPKKKGKKYVSSYFGFVCFVVSV